MNYYEFFEISFLCFALLYLLFLTSFLIVFISNIIIENKTNKNLKKEQKHLAFKIESYLAYNNDEDNFTKKEILEIIKEILKKE